MSDSKFTVYEAELTDVEEKKDQWFYVLETPLGTVFADYRRKTFDEQLRALIDPDHVVVLFLDKDSCFEHQIQINQLFKTMSEVSELGFPHRLVVSAHGGIEDEDAFQTSFREYIDNNYGPDSEFANRWVAPVGTTRGGLQKGSIELPSKFPKGWNS